MTTQARTAAFTAFTARRAFVEALRVKHGFAADDMALEGGDATAFFAELAAYDAADVKPAEQTHEIQFLNKATGKWHQLETFASEKAAEAALKRQQKKARFGVYRVAPVSLIVSKYSVGTKVRVSSAQARADGLTDTQVFIAQVVRNNGYMADCAVLHHEFEENVLLKVVAHSFAVDTATYEIVE